MNFLSFLVVIVIVVTVFAESTVDSNWKSSLDRILAKTEKVEPEVTSNALRSVSAEANNYLNGYFTFEMYANPLSSCGDSMAYFYAIRLNKCFDIGVKNSAKSTARVTTSGKLQMTTALYSDSSCGKKMSSDSYKTPNNVCTYGTKFEVVNNLPAEPPLNGLFTSQYDTKKKCGSGDYRLAEYVEISAVGYCSDGVKVTSCNDKIKAHVYKKRDGKCEGKYKMVTEERGCKTKDFYGENTYNYVKYTCV